MKITSIIGIALFALRRNKSRSLLTGLGVIIGVMSVIAMLSLGEGAQNRVQAEIASMGTNMLVVSAGSQRSGGLRGGMGTDTSLTTDDAKAIASDCVSVAAASPGVGLPVTVVAANQNWTTRADGAGESYLAIRNWAVKSGEFFGTSDIRTNARVAVIGKTVSSQLFPDDDPLGQTIRIRNLAFRIIGVLAEKGQSEFGQDQDDIVLMPYTTAMKKLLSTTHVSAIFVSARNADTTSRAQTEIQDLLRQRHNLRTGQEDDFTVRNLTDLARTAEQTTSTMTLLLGCIAGVSLLVGGIGIMNIMLVSVTERTREIGLRMAVGAKAKQVRLQFLTESVVLGLAGGIAGIVLGAAVSVGIAVYFGWPRFVSVSAILQSVMFSFLVGVFFGYYPAHKAAALNPIEALRYE